LRLGIETRGDFGESPGTQSTPISLPILTLSNSPIPAHKGTPQPAKNADPTASRISSHPFRKISTLVNPGCNEPALIDTFGVCFEEVSGISTFLANGYHSWDSSKYHDAASVIGEKTIRSYAVTQLIPEDHSKVLTFGFDRHDRYQQYFVHAQREGHHCIQAVSCWDRKNPGCLTLSSEKIIFCRTETVEEGLEIWAKFIAEKSFLKPRIPPKRVVGWCSWYNLYAAG